MAKVVNFSSAALNEATSEQNGPSLQVFLKDFDDAGNALAGTDRVYVRVAVEVARDDGGPSELVYIERQLAAVPNGIISNANKLAFWNHVKSLYSAARAVATND